MAFLIIILAMFFVLIIAIVYIWRDNSEGYKESKLGEVETVKNFTSDFKKNRHEHNMSLILNLIEGNTQMGSETLLLSPLKGHYRYYYHEDLIVWVSNEMCKDLKEMGYNVYNDSSNNLIINYDK
jgi:hypothetical protein